MVLVDSLGLGNEISSSKITISTIIDRLIQELSIFCKSFDVDIHFIDTHIRQNFDSNGFQWIYSSLSNPKSQISNRSPKSEIKIGPFSVPCLNQTSSSDKSFNFAAPTTATNLARILRALQLDRSILLEGPPGAGKTGIVQALAEITGNHLVRINLSEQTDLMDLLGSDLPSAQRTSLWSREINDLNNDKNNSGELFRYSCKLSMRVIIRCPVQMV